MLEGYVDITVRMNEEDVSKTLRAFEYLQERYNDELEITLPHIGWTIRMTYQAAVKFVEDVCRGVDDVI